MINKKLIRQRLRQQRQQLSAQQQLTAAQQLKDIVIKQEFFLQCQHIAFYIANDGEIDPLPLLHLCETLDKSCYLPILHVNTPGSLGFVQYHQNDPLKPNRFGIPEPIPNSHNELLASELDCVFVPLIAFDQHGNRLGMGAGYYDKTFEFTKNKLKRKPLLIGLAHDFQRVDNLPHDRWDIPLNKIITNQHIYEGAP